jgi:hypothetical protein
MSQKIPSFITGANAKIRAGGKTFAYASDVSYSVSVDTIPVETMGRYEAVSNEPVNYSVAGALSVVRYTKIAKQNGMPGAAANGNGLGNVTNEGGDNMSNQINPGNMLLSQTWDLDVFQKTEPSSGTYVENSVIKITDCRFTRKSSNLTKRGLMVDQLAFVGILAQDDSFSASHSGDDDLS